jgi:hypothetical protein
MILIFEMVWPGAGHAITNSATIQTIARGFPEQEIRVFAEATHIEELRAASVLAGQPNVSLRTVPISAQFTYRPHIVSVRRGLRELWTLLSALHDVPRHEPCLIVLISATPTAILAGSLLVRLMRRPIAVQVGMHGNLNDAFGWRPRNPLSRSVDLHAALRRRHGGRVRFLVLENAIRKALMEQIPNAGDITDVLPLPINRGEADAATPMTLTRPVRIGLVGQATEAKGILPFLDLARTFRESLPGAVAFHVVGMPGAGIDVGKFAVLHDEPPYVGLSRPDFVERLQRLHYVCLPLHTKYYGLAASGALIDAITWLKPIIATPLPIVVDLFTRFGDIGFLCETTDQMQTVIDGLVREPDQARYDRQVANLQRLRASRLPAALASNYRTMVATTFPGLLTGDLVPAAGDLCRG